MITSRSDYNNKNLRMARHGEILQNNACYIHVTGAPTVADQLRELQREASLPTPSPTIPHLSYDHIISLTPKERLKLLKQVYKIGTQYKSPASGKIHCVEEHDSLFGKVMSSDSINAGEMKGYLYYNNKWAEIIETEDETPSNFPPHSKIIAMDTERRVEFLKKLFPLGTIYQTPSNGETHVMYAHKSRFGNLFEDSGNIDAGELMGYLYYNGEWARIISVQTNNKEQNLQDHIDPNLFRSWDSAIRKRYLMFKYPLGTMFICPRSNTENIVLEHDRHFGNMFSDTGNVGAHNGTYLLFEGNWAKIVTRKPIQKFEDFPHIEEILELSDAERIQRLIQMYPIGTKYICPMDYVSRTIQTYGSNYGRILDNGEAIDAGIHAGYLFCDGNWAKILHDSDSVEANAEDEDIDVVEERDMRIEDAVVLRRRYRANFTGLSHSLSEYDGEAEDSDEEYKPVLITEGNEQEEPKFIKTCKRVRKPFDLFSFELTFQPDPSMLPSFYNESSNWKVIYNEMAELVENKFHDKTENRFTSDFFIRYTDKEIFEHDIDVYSIDHEDNNLRIEQDDNDIEIPTGLLYNYQHFRKQYVILCDTLKQEFGFIPSSKACMISEGGCHTNVDLTFVGKHNRKIDFCKYLHKFIFHNPYIAWMFLSPHDNNSSIVNCKFNDLAKGCFMYPRSGYDYLELRFFMMPRTLKEFDLHYKFAKALIEYVYECFCNKKTIFPKSYDFKVPKFENSVAQMKILCDKIGIKFSDIESVGKVELLKQRYELGKSHLK